MTTGIAGRQRTAVSLSAPVTSSDPVELLDRAVDALYQVNRALPRTVLGREELIALGGLLTQISGALLTLTGLLSAATRPYDYARLRRAHADATAVQRSPGAAILLRDCRDGYLAAHKSARAFHADLRWCPRAGSHERTG